MSAANWLDNFGKESASPPAQTGSSDSAGTASAPNPASTPIGDPVSLKTETTNIGDALSAPLESSPAPEGQAPKEGQQDGSKQQADGKTPEAGEYTPFQLPDGLAISEAHQAALTAYGKENNLSQEAVQQVVNLGVEVEQQTRAAIEAESAQEMQAVRAEWRKELLADPELGGANLARTQENMNLFQQSKLSDPGLVDFLQSTGLVANPNVVRLLSRIGASLREQPVSMGGSRSDAPGGGNRQPEKELYAKSGHN